ncbi:MAG: methyl-accepting chemotaxis protein [Deltaproteobacteria bacterium]|nr:methyl-accepting chemotaxis protein [Deltaproteobacteria bacterium]
MVTFGGSLGLVGLNDLVNTGGDFSSRLLRLSAGSVVLCVLFAFLLIQWLAKKISWYESLLDSLPFPITVTDLNRNWIYINKHVEAFLGQKRTQVYGLPCSNWGAAICNTENCGINRLEEGKSATFFNQKGMDFKVYLSYLTDKNGKKIGHIETVDEITEFINRQRAEIDLAQNIKSAIVELSGSMAEISEKTKDNANLAGRAAELAGMMEQNAEKGSAQMDEMMSAVKKINQSSQGINNVIKVINDIAFQTNLLALNASVEAARVGEHGKGFAVVAEEVRNLAARSAAAAQNTNALIQDSMEKAELGVSIASETATSLVNIVSGIADSNQIAAEIAKSSEEQSSFIQQINNALAKVTKLVEQEVTLITEG